MIEAMRDIGYSLESAVADIIDNSITAKAARIDVRYGWTGDSPWIAVIDDGEGMSSAELLEAMRPGSRNPLSTRDRSDLGRFGLGLKTASFSQCRRLTALTRSSAGTAVVRWDLDVVSETDRWSLITVDPEEVSLLPGNDIVGEHGTLVLWQKLDRLELNSIGPQGHELLNDHMETVREHIARIFHRFLAGEPGLKRIEIRINNADVEPFDPFNERNLATQGLPEERVSLHGDEVVIQPFILPHHSKVSPSEYQRMAGSEGYLRNQGFYIYRNRRLIIWGTWFRLARQEELTKLARIRVDIPNTLDHQWGIDVRKSRAQPPSAVRQRMKQIVERIRGSAKRPYTHRGVLITTESLVSIWNRRRFNDRIIYEINSDHPVIEDLRSDIDETSRRRLDTILKMVANSFPAAAFFSDYATDPKSLEASSADEAMLVELAQLVIRGNPGVTPEEFEVIVSKLEPFASWPGALPQVITRAFMKQN